MQAYYRITISVNVYAMRVRVTQREIKKKSAGKTTKN